MNNCTAAKIRHEHVNTLPSRALGFRFGMTHVQSYTLVMTNNEFARRGSATWVSAMPRKQELSTGALCPVTPTLLAPLVGLFFQTIALTRRGPGTSS